MRLDGGANTDEKLEEPTSETANGWYLLLFVPKRRSAVGAAASSGPPTIRSWELPRSLRYSFSTSRRYG